MQKPPHRNGTTAAHPSFTSRESLASPTLGRQAPSNGTPAPVDSKSVVPDGDAGKAAPNPSVSVRAGYARDAGPRHRHHCNGGRDGIIRWSDSCRPPIQEKSRRHSGKERSRDHIIPGHGAGSAAAGQRAPPPHSHGIGRSGFSCRFALEIAERGIGDGRGNPNPCARLKS